MIVVDTIHDLPLELQQKIKAESVRRILKHFMDRPHVSDAKLKQVLGFNRQTILDKAPWLKDELAKTSTKPTSFRV